MPPRPQEEWSYRQLCRPPPVTTAAKGCPYKGGALCLPGRNSTFVRPREGWPPQAQARPCTSPPWTPSRWKSSLTSVLLLRSSPPGPTGGKHRVPDLTAAVVRDLHALLLHINGWEHLVISCTVLSNNFVIRTPALVDTGAT